jgi:hypothetical protein
VKNSKTGKILSPGKHRGGYIQNLLWDGYKYYARYVHRLVAKAFIGNIDGFQVDHLDNDRTNNHVDNLEWVTTRENQLHVRDVLGSKSNKINMTIANEIRKLYKSGKYTHIELAEMFGIRKTQVGYIIQNKRWVVSE